MSEEKKELTVEDELTMLIIQLEERQEQLRRTIVELEAEVQRLSQIARY